MPTKRTRRTRRSGLDDYKRQQLLDGPRISRLAGVGYLAGSTELFFDNCSPERQASILSEMEADWRHYGPALMEWWNLGDAAGTGEVKPWTYVQSRAPHELPWAAEQFGIDTADNNNGRKNKRGSAITASTK